jgi:hypothetical protein
MISEGTKIYRCPHCKKEMKKRDYRKRGLMFMICGLLLFPLLLLISYGTIVPFLELFIFIVIGFLFILKKKRFFYFCKGCQTSYYESDIEDEDEEGLTLNIK